MDPGAGIFLNGTSTASCGIAQVASNTTGGLASRPYAAFELSANVTADSMLVHEQWLRRADAEGVVWSGGEGAGLRCGSGTRSSSIGVDRFTMVSAVTQQCGSAPVSIRVPPMRPGNCFIILNPQT